MNARDASGSAPQHSHPHNNTMSRNEKFWVDQVTVPHPPPGTTRGGERHGGGEGTCMATLASSGRVAYPIIAGLRCRPGVHPCIAPRPVRYALRPEPGSLPQDHPGSGVAPWLPPGQLHGNSSTSPSSPCHPVCCLCIGAFTAGGARGSEAASTAHSIWRFPQKGYPWCTAATARLQTCPIRGSIPQPFGCETYA